MFYDWPALKSVVRNCLASDSDRFKINDLFNLLDLHIPLKLGFRAGGGAEDPIPFEQRFYDARRLSGARNALLMILTALFHIDYQLCLETKTECLEKYREFAIKIGERSQQKGKDLAAAAGYRRISPISTKAIWAL